MKKFEQLKLLLDTMNRVYKESSDSEMYVSAITADFDRLFELSWKVLKEYLKELGFRAANSGSPREIIKLAYREKIINDGNFWLTMLKDRNDDSHHYNESLARAYVSRIRRDYLPFIESFVKVMLDYIPDESGTLLRVPRSFLDAKNKSGLEYDEFLDKVKLENGYKSDLEVFESWDKIQRKYLDHTMEAENR